MRTKAQDSERKRVWWASLSADEKTKISVAKTARYAVANICTRCGSRPPIENRKTCEICRQKLHIKDIRQGQKLKLDVINAYGGKCVCCGVVQLSMLTIDHVNNDGNEHRKAIDYKGGTKIYRWLRQQNYPSGFQVLCFNCNLSKHINGGSCEHICAYKYANVISELELYNAN